MKILVLTCSTGGGHNSCARYITAEFKKNNISCDCIDYFNLIGKNASKIAENIYLTTTLGNGKIFKGLYKLGELYNKTGLISPVYGINKMTCGRVLKFIKAKKYDIVICTHLFPALAITSLKEKEDITLINVATDYRVIPFWNETNPDYFVIPSKLLKKEFKAAGFKDKILVCTGIPVSSDFKNVKKLNLPKDKKRILITSGSMGFGNLCELVKILLSIMDAYIIVVTGNNSKMYRELSKIKNDNLLVKGYIKNLNDYIAASDVVLTKPGGLTTTEVAVLNKPFIHINPIPGVENYNASFFYKNKMSLIGRNNNEIIKNIIKLLYDDKLRKKMIKNQQKIINDKSASDLVKFVKENIISKKEQKNEQ